LMDEGTVIKKMLLSVMKNKHISQSSRVQTLRYLLKAA